MKKAIVSVLTFLLSRPSFFIFNKTLLVIALHGLGIGNWRSNRAERRFLRALSRRLAGAAVILDIGANRGDYAALARAALPEARIYAFEPHPGNFAKLADLAAALEFEAIASACGAAPGTMTLYDYPGGEGSSHASAFRAVIEEYHVAQSQGRSEAVEVPVTTVDRFLQERTIAHVDLMKIDVEGLEMSVLEGAKDALDAGRVGMVQFEFNEMNVHSRTFFRDFSTFLQEFDFYRILNNGALLPLAGQPGFLLEIFFYQNIVAVRRARGAT